MEEEVGIKVTRLRRRLSVEADDVKSPSTQSTPTKKRGGRLAAKPQLELINENATEAEKPPRTRKSTARDTEPEEKAVTPARRSTRIKSNTSIVSETPIESEDKGTPSRRSTRIKSNTSLVAETVQFADSPRAKRAARRLSQVGSDNEAPVTPARQTRRTRKDSASSIDKQVEPVSKLGTQIQEVIAEEVESSGKNTTSNDSPSKERNVSPTVRKSPRLNEKTGRRSSSHDDKENEPQSVLKSIVENKDEKSDIGDDEAVSSSRKVNNEIIQENNLSINNLIKDLESEPNKGKSDLNKTTTEVELPQVKTKRHRTKSWTTITLSPSNDKDFLSDTEAIKKKNKRNNVNFTGSGDGILNISNEKTQEKQENEQVLLNHSITSEKKRKKAHDKSITGDSSIINTSSKIDSPTVENKESSVIITKNKNDFNSSQEYDPHFTEKFLATAPSGAVQTLIYIEDSDSNTEPVEKIKSTDLESEDQCVPVVEHQLESKNNLSYEPMDIDETMPENVSISVFTDKSDLVKEEKRKSVHNISQANYVSMDNSINKSQRKSTILNLEKDSETTHNKSKVYSMMTDNNDDTTNKSLNKSKRKSVSDNKIDHNIDEDTNKSKNQSTIVDRANQSLNKSKRKSISNTKTDDNVDNNSLDIDGNDSMNKSCNNSERNSSITVDQDNSVNKGNKFHRKSSISNIDSEDDNNVSQSKRKSSISRVMVDDKMEKDLSIGVIVNEEIINTSSNKSKRKSSIQSFNMDNSLNNKSINDDIDNVTAVNKSLNKSKSTSSIADTDNDIVAKYVEKSNKNSSVSEIIDNDVVDSSSIQKISNENSDIVNKSSIKSKRNSAITDDDKDKTMDENSNKSRRKSSITHIDVDEDMDKNLNKSKRKSSISQTFDKSSNESKSTLILSQLKDTSDTNVPKDIYAFNDSTEQLSKSINIPNVKKNNESDKNNLSSTYSTSTPLQQKSTKKLAMQINTSIIAPNSVSKVDKKEGLNRSKKENSVLSPNYEEDEEDSSEEGCSGEEEEDSNEEECSEEEEDDSEEESNFTSKSKMVDDEAEEASADYESGDSRDDEEREYEEQHEILEKGETLDSEEEDFSDDSDYEKGSFIVDSDDEDDDLLSGSGDDLSMSADELSMSAKSKKKFNERQIKKQKKASREMFEARHKLNESDKIAKSNKTKPKKSGRQRLESSDEESSEDVNVQPKKHRRARIDSSQDSSQPQADADEYKSNKKNKVKRLSESTCEEAVANEKEISIIDDKEVDKVDPLSLQNIIKEEPKTPQIDLNISTTAITNIEELEEVQIDQNVSVIKLNQTTDPLHATVAHDEASEDESDVSISENEEITQNYESMLKNLNNNTKKVKELDISLNLNKKTKEKVKEPIVDQLNLTEVKKPKKKKIDTGESSEPTKSNRDKSLSTKTSIKVNKPLNILDEGSSDSIDMKLLFNEDSTDGEAKIITSEGNNDMEVVEDFIPLKRTEAKINILDRTDDTPSGMEKDSKLNVSKSKKNKRKSSQSEVNVTMNEPENEDLCFFVDTTGDLNQVSTNTPKKDSAKKKKQKNNLSLVNIEETNNVLAVIDPNDNDAPLEVLYRSEKNKLDLDATHDELNTTADTLNQSGKKKNRSEKNKSKLDLDATQDELNTTSDTLNQSGKKKKKNKKSFNNSQQNIEEALFEDTGSIQNDVAEKTNNASALSVEGITKMKKKKLSESQVEQGTEMEPETILNVSAGSAKKQKKKTNSESSVVENIIEDTNVVNESKKTKKRKRKSSANLSIEKNIVKDDPYLLDTSKSLNESVTNQKKKRKVTLTDEVIIPETQSTSDVPEQPTSAVSNILAGKKKKNKSNPEEKMTAEADEYINITKKKNKKRKERDDDESDKLPKVIKQNSSDKIHVPRLPAELIKQLDNKPPRDTETKAKVISTTSFKVEETKRRRNKPSEYLEQSVYLNDSVEDKPKKSLLTKPKVLPFIPTASTSDHGFTTKFRINVIPQDTKFVAQSSDLSNFKKECLHKNRIKKLGTFEMYKRHRSVKMSKF